MTEDDHQLRVSDQQRETIANELREHYAAGRLTDDEFNDRVARAYEAKTTRELEALRADLPKLPASLAQQRAELAERRRHLQGRLLQQTGGSLGAFLICTAIWVAAGAHGQFWPIWVALVAIIGLARSAWRLYGPAPELDRVEEELARRERRRIDPGAGKPGEPDWGGRERARQRAFDRADRARERALDRRERARERRERRRGT